MQCSGELIKKETLSKECKGYHIRKHELEFTILINKGEKKHLLMCRGKEKALIKKSA